MAHVWCGAMLRSLPSHRLVCTASVYVSSDTSCGTAAVADAHAVRTWRSGVSNHGASCVSYRKALERGECCCAMNACMSRLRGRPCRCCCCRCDCCLPRLLSTGVRAGWRLPSRAQQLGPRGAEGTGRVRLDDREDLRVHHVRCTHTIVSRSAAVLM